MRRAFNGEPPRKNYTAPSHFDWDKITTICNGVPDELEAKQVMTTTGVQKCSKSPLKVQQYIGASSTLDPLSYRPISVAT